jgi:hypothetical protein
MSDEPNKYVNACFSIEQYKTTYQHVLQPVEHESAWPVSPNPRPLPPRVKKMPGRPQTKRRMDPSERVNSNTKSSRVGIQIRCGRCHGTGHNKKTCSVDLVFTHFNLFIFISHFNYFDMPLTISLCCTLAELRRGPFSCAFFSE